MEFLDQVLAILSKGEAQAVVLAMIFEFAFRFSKTEKPLSVAHLIAAGCHKIGDIAKGVANILDKVLPQKLK